jgi:hypothetical protein
MHTDYNWELFQRMNPNHPKAIEPQFAGAMYWFEAGWGHWGAWAKDSLRDSPVPEMPAPSPLWERMIATPLRFERYGGSPEPPPVPPEPGPWPINDLRGELAWHATQRWQPRPAAPEYIVVHHSAVEVPTAITVRQHIHNINAYHIGLGWPRIGYHYCIGTAGVIWHCNELTDVTYHAGNKDMNSRSVGICLLGDMRLHDPTQQQLDSLKWLRGQLNLPALAHKNVVETYCPGPWWERYVDWLHNGEEPEPEPEPEPLRIYDLAGGERDWLWVQNVYGQVRILPPAADYGAYRLVELREREGPAIYLATVRDEFGQPEQGAWIVRTWPGAPDLPDDKDVRQHGNTGIIGIANENGEHGFGGGPGDYYNPAAGPGPTTIWVGEGPSEAIAGLGFLPLTEHRRLDPVFRWVVNWEPPEPEPPEPTPDLEEVRRLIMAAQALLYDALSRLP